MLLAFGYLISSIRVEGKSDSRNSYLFATSPNLFETVSKTMELLDDILVLDLAGEEGSFCSKLLADMGAKVIKVEIRAGDPARTDQIPFSYHNSGKLGFVLDPNSRKNVRAFRTLLKKADVLVETFSPGKLWAPLCSVPSLRRANPGLIHISITPFGKTGPSHAYSGCDAVASASGGQMYLTREPAGRPVASLGYCSAYTASLFGAIGTLLGLQKRKRTGNGCYFDLSVQESVASTLDHARDGTVAVRQGIQYPGHLFSILPCKDGYIQIAILQYWETILEIMIAEGKAADLAEEVWQQESYRESHFDHIAGIVATWTATRTRKDLFELGQAMRFPWAPVEFPLDVIESPQLSARRFFSPKQLAGLGAAVPFPGQPYKINSHAQPQECSSPKYSRDPGGAGVCSSSEILKGIRVLDLTRMLSGPYATRILADFGAEVIKIQSGAERNDTPYFAAWNRNKRSIRLDLNRPEARDLFLKLVAISDVVVENFSPRVMSNWGLNYEHLREVRSNLIMASISAMGRTGPWKNFVGLAPTFHALSGLLSTIPTNPPANLGHAFGDVITGLYAAFSILACLANRNRSGKGSLIDISAYESLCTFVGADLIAAAVNSEWAAKSGWAARCGCYRCEGNDSWCVIAPVDDRHWPAFCRVLDVPELKAAQYAGFADRSRNQQVLDRLIGRLTAGCDAESIVRRMQDAGIAAAVVQNGADLAKDEQLRARSFFTELEHPVLGPLRVDRSALWPWREKPDWRPAPLLGQDNHYIVVELLGHSESEYAELLKKTVI
jgi:crotonobetainyl-CoA:carnitine CoA-transferase CaiB-like acyl-CoA transferase